MQKFEEEVFHRDGNYFSTQYDDTCHVSERYSNKIVVSPSASDDQKYRHYIQKGV